MSGVFRTGDPPPPHPSPPIECVLPPHQRRKGTHSPAVRGGGQYFGRRQTFWIGLLQYNPSTTCTYKTFISAAKGRIQSSITSLIFLKDFWGMFKVLYFICRICTLCMPIFCRRQYFVNTKILSTLILCRHQYFGDANILSTLSTPISCRCLYLVDAYISSTPIFCRRQGFSRSLYFRIYY